MHIFHMRIQYTPYVTDGRGGHHSRGGEYRDIYESQIYKYIHTKRAIIINKNM